MKKISRKNLVKTIFLFLVTVFQFSGLHALNKATTWGDSLADGVRESIDNDIHSPARLAFDGDKETFWALSSEKTQGFVERYFDKEIDVGGISTELYLPEGTALNILWKKNGTFLPYENGIIKGPVTGAVNLSFVDIVRKTNSILFSLEGETAEQARIYEIQINERENYSRFTKIKPVKYSFNQNEYINLKPERLWSGNTGETWYEPLWYIPWEIQQTNEFNSDIFAPYNGHPSKEAEIIWELNGEYKIELLKTYFRAENRNIAFEFWNGKNWTNKIQIAGNPQKGWFQREITSGITTDRIRITFPAGWEFARFINQIEIWGEGEKTNSERKVLFEKDSSKGIWRSSISDIKDAFEIFIITEASEQSVINLKVNEDDYKARPVYKNENYTVWQSKIISETLRDGTQFLELDCGNLQLNNVTIQNSDDNSIDNSLYGGPLKNKDVCIELWSAEENVNNNSCILGWIGNPEAEVCVDGTIHMRQAGNLFWIPVRECEGSYLNTEKHSAVAQLGGKKSVRRYTVDASDDTQDYEEKIINTKLGLSIDIPFGTLVTQKEFITVSGCVGNGNNVNVKVNGIESELTEDRFSEDVELSEGRQIITVTASDSTGRTEQKTVEIIRDSRSPEIEIIAPVENQYINTGVASFTVDGIEDDLWWQFNDDEWETGYGRYKNKDFILEDGFYSYTVRAQDRAGNISERKSVDFCMDKTVPASFEILLNVEGWTNNNTPIAEFETTDKTSGISHYEYRIDENNWQTCKSPLQLETLSDGKRMLQIRAIDKAGNIKEEIIEIDVDTSCPPVPENARSVPDENSIFVKWNGLEDNSISDGELVTQEGGRSYVIERNPQWKDGLKVLNNYGYGKLYYEDEDTIQGENYSYRIWVVDRAGNESEKTPWKSAIAGLATAEIEEVGDTIVEFEGLTLTIPEGTTAQDILRIQIKEIPQRVLTEVDRPKEPLIGGIYSVTAVRKNGSSEAVTNHAELLNDAAIEIGYSRSLLPDNYDESELAVFYYDDLWGSWLEMPHCYIDRTNQIIRCKTNHFTEFCVMATKSVILTEAEMREGTYSLNTKETGYGGIDISGEDGGVSNLFTEFFLPGKNGLDLSIQRVYSTAKTLEDSSEDEYIDIHGGKVWQIADGWRINMPYMMRNGEDVAFYGTDGTSTLLSQMQIRDYQKNGNSKKLLMESHEYSDLITELEFTETQRNVLFWTETSHKFNGAILHQADGKKVYFKADGKVEKITDYTGKNIISFSYEGNQITVTDSYGRIIIFKRQNGMIFQIDFGNRTVNYTVEKEKVYLVKSGKENQYKIKNITRLVSAKDVGAREWKYKYSSQLIRSSSRILEPEEENEADISSRCYVLLTDISGAQSGYTKISYVVTEDIAYTDDIVAYGIKYVFKVLQEKIAAKAKTVWESESAYDEGKPYLRTSLVNVRFTEPLEKNVYVDHSSIYDGKTTVSTEYEIVKKKRHRISLAPEALRGTSNPNAFAALADRNVQILTYAKERFIYDGITDNGKLIKKENSEISEELMRITKKETIKGGNENNSITDSYSYDDYGNVVTETHEFSTDGIASGTEINRTFKSVINNRMNLPETITTNNYSDNVSNTSVLENESYAYNNFGQLISKTLGTDIVTTYSYYDTDGQLKEVISPEGNKILYTYEYVQPELYKTVITYKDVAGVNDGVDVGEEFVYEQRSGNLIKQKDKDGYVSVMQYDSLGRITNQKKYHNKNVETGVYSEVKVSYDENANTSTVTDELGCITVNYFDGIGRLIKVSKKGNTLESHSLAQKEKTITVCLAYDNYDCVIKISEPSYTEPSLKESDFIGTRYEYDSQNRVIRKTDSDKNITEIKYDDAHNIVSQSIYKTVAANDGYAVQLDGKTTTQKDNFGNTIKETQYFAADDEEEVSEKSISYTYDGKGRKVKSVDVKGNVTEYKYNFQGLLVETLYPNGLKDFNTYNKDGYISATEAKDSSITLSKTQYKTNALGYVYEEEALTGTELTSQSVVTTRKFDGRGNVLSEKIQYKNDATDIREKKWTYDWKGNILSETDGEGNATTFTYDNKGNETSLADPRQTVASYNAEFRMICEYDSFGRLVKGWLPQTVKREAGTAPDVYLVYDAQGNNIYRKDAENVETEYSYSNAGKLLEQNTDGYKTLYEYNGAGKIIRVTNPDGTWTQYTYDLAGNVTYERIKGNPAAIKYTYDRNGNVKSVTDRNGNKTVYEYDSMNRAINENNANLMQKAITYDKLGRVISEEDGEKNRRSYEYDMLGRLVKENVNDENSTELNYEYDARGNVISFKDAKGSLFQRQYNKTDKLISETVFDNGTERERRTYSYDEASGLKSVSDGNNTVYYNGVASDYQPDAYGNTRKEKWSKTGFEMSYDYDKLNRLTSVTTPDAKKENYSYNKNYQVIRISGLINGALSYNNSRIEAVTLNDGFKKQYGYNEAGLISRLAYSSETNDSLHTGFDYLYDRNFNITERTHLDSAEKDSFVYDGINRLTQSRLKGKFSSDTYEQFDLFHMNEIARDIDGTASENDTEHTVLNGQFFPADKVTLDENGKSFVYDFTEVKEIQKIELFKTNLERKSRIRERDWHIYTKQNKDDGWTELASDNWNYEVDPKNQSIHFNLKNSLKTQFLKIRTIWDDRNIENENVSDYVTFSNDSVQKMIRIWTVTNHRDENYTYDKNSNRTSLTENGKSRNYLYYKNAIGGNTARVMYDGKWWYTYDKNGNRTARASNATHNNNKVTLDKTGEYWEYTWDYHNRLVKVQQYNAPDNAANVCVEYTYDALNRRIERISRTNTEPEVTQYAYGRNGALAYQKKSISGKDTERTFVYLNNQIIAFVDEKQNETEKKYFTVTDIQGSITEVYDENETLVWKSGYTAFGILACEVNNSIDFDGLYTGCDYDTESGLTYHWNRWRSENGVSFISQDPARDGLNWYGYAGQNPATFIDLDGCVPRKPTPTMGSQAHYYIQNALKNNDAEKGIPGSSQFYLRNPSGEWKGAYFVDYQRISTKGEKEFYEIKPISYLKNERGDKQLDKYIKRDGEAVVGTELLPEIAEMEPMEVLMNTSLGIEYMEIKLTVDPENHPGMIFYELDDGRTPEEYALKVTEKIVAPIVSAALIVVGAGTVPEIPTIPAPMPVPVPAP